ncbi:MAG: hypothetical protein U0L09_05850, partial [Christensenellales bacterium]|nr:hypothetical protein [Christensenellales bacterium]
MQIDKWYHLYGRKDDVVLEEVPKPEPNRKKGKWSFIGYQMFECTECGTFYTQSQFQQMRVMITDPEFPRFCPTCGADM